MKGELGLGHWVCYWAYSCSLGTMEGAEAMPPWTAGLPGSHVIFVGVQRGQKTLGTRGDDKIVGVG
jgi:hypothetical protein